MATETTTIRGMGHSVKRKEDARFLRGRGKYVDDITLPGMLFMDIVRSPFAHANIISIDPSKALAHEGVLAVITGKDLDAAGLAWMPTLMSDKQMVLPVDRVVYQAQEVAAVVATDRYTAADGAALVEVEYEALQPVIDPHKALDADSPLVRPDREQKTNHIWHWEAGDAAQTDAAFAQAEVVVEQDLYIPRIHVSSIETCGCVASFDAVEGKLTVYMTTQAPHAIRTVFSLVTGIPEHKIRIISPDIGGGFGGKVPVYPGYVIACVAAIKTGHPIKWIEDRSENLQADSFARDYHISAQLAAKRDGTMQALRVKTLADHGAFDAAANPSKFPAGLFSIVTGSYDLAAAHVEVDGVYTNKPSGGVAYRCSFRVTEAVHTIERLVDRLAQEIHMDPAELRLKNFIQPEQFPYKSPTGWEYDSGNYPAALRKAMEKIGYADLRREQAEKR
ncbi:MAG TPA: molybdopterin cofactor-binding domain-containing protein, partial [Chloroflexota bacterium]|nr:molybdopterin cofactor-binding domain-containing protein [Chloroflexota bacterium]